MCSYPSLLLVSYKAFPGFGAYKTSFYQNTISIVPDTKKKG
jgi:hypothetical protein